MQEQQDHCQKKNPRYHPHLRGDVNIPDHVLTVKKEEFMPKKLYKESPLMPPKPSVICKGYTFFPPWTQRANICFHEEWPLPCTRRMKEQGKNRGRSLWKGIHTKRALTLKVGVGLSPERVLVSTDSRALQKRCTALKTEVHWQHGSVTAEELPGYFSISLLFFGKVHFFEIRTVCRKGSVLINPLSLFFFLKTSCSHFSVFF